MQFFRNKKLLNIAKKVASKHRKLVPGKRELNFQKA